MFPNKKNLLALAIAGTTVASVNAEEATIDPSDVTNVYTQAAVMVGGNSDIKPVAMISGGYDNGHTFAFLGEATFGKDDKSDNADNQFGFKFKDARAQYFHVLNTGNTYLPKAGFSLDGITQTSSSMDTDLLAVGTLAAINPKYTPGFMMFPQVAYVNGEMDFKALDYKESVDGFSTALIMTRTLGDSGAFMLFYPEYQNLSGDNIDIEGYKLQLNINAPMTENRRWWLNTRFDYSQQTIDAGMLSVKTEESQAYLGVRYFF
ncbi:hypothetical protein [uncultured Vibrio sp.]|uniref:hypothetical protein n=1 Tax=uncultured Vibrio sp. TaxID=114054 RepID=UPI0025E1DF2C|nr:hypothetical protein [uncultured Vibrio sp.]